MMENNFFFDQETFDDLFLRDIRERAKKDWDLLEYKYVMMMKNNQLLRLENEEIRKEKKAIENNYNQLSTLLWSCYDLFKNHSNVPIELPESLIQKTVEQLDDINHSIIQVGNDVKPKPVYSRPSQKRKQAPNKGPQSKKCIPQNKNILSQQVYPNNQQQFSQYSSSLLKEQKQINQLVSSKPNMKQKSIEDFMERIDKNFVVVD